MNDEDVRAEFGACVTMTATELREWLHTDESKRSGQHKHGESTGHQSGRRTVAILDTKKADLNEQATSTCAPSSLPPPAPGAAPRRRRAEDDLAALADELGPRPAESVLIALDRVRD
ncbi:hypothetical protein Amsp01_089520 [Amycolatopsis sp. NBRC 101858]|uniref:DUF3140 domain-containing protein n=1 Tax=Amycolatopsis sp. NBRC 101858 TaxID=3032200 RepID=UPI0024A4482C|nr:DUF3140 domain-containing protein [Amycolatopsis sp. NBRC 101858]GLY42929.1 hypothetical protein Amsp01_089520 [Amycolatopsis sp. NBRC 101858]